MRIKFFPTVIFFPLLYSSLFAQQTNHIKGNIRNTKDSSAIAFAAIGLNQMSTSCTSGLDGKFDMPLSPTNSHSPDTINIYSLGYENYHYPLKNITRIFMMVMIYTDIKS